MKLSIVSTKGGPGKTTSAMHLAQALTRHGTVDVWDADPQGSATEWAALAEDDGDPLDFDVRPVNARTLERAAAGKGITTDHVVIDTPPGHPSIIEAAIRASDVVIVPTEASAMDMTRMWRTIDATGDTPRIVLITKAVPRTRSHRAALDALAAAEAPVFDTCIPRREPIKNTYGTRLRSDRLHGYDDVLSELATALGIDLPTDLASTEGA